VLEIAARLANKPAERALGHHQVERGEPLAALRDGKIGRARQCDHARALPSRGHARRRVAVRPPRMVVSICIRYLSVSNGVSPGGGRTPLHLAAAAGA